MKNFSLFISIILISFNCISQSKKKSDINAIRSMCGCYEVSFNFAETFNYSNDSIYTPSKNYSTGALEWAQIVKDEKDEISIQHILIAGSSENPYVIKHWRQDWIYQNTDFYIYRDNNTWNYLQKNKNDVKGQWTQKVFQVDDSPRYEGSGTWVHVDGRSFWASTANAPLPRREITKRQDYNVTLRRNHHEVFDWGWNHDQDNDKIIRELGKEDIILAQEKGLNIYKKVENSRCIDAQNFWIENKAMWKMVRNQWDLVFAKQKDLSLKNKVDNKRLYQYLFALEPNSKFSQIESIITSFIL